MSAVRLLPMVVRSSVKRIKEGTPAGGFSPSSPSRTSRAHWWSVAANIELFCCLLLFFLIFVEVGRAGQELIRSNEFLLWKANSFDRLTAYQVPQNFLRSKMVPVPGIRIDTITTYHTGAGYHTTQYRVLCSATLYPGYCNLAGLASLRCAALVLVCIQVNY